MCGKVKISYEKVVTDVIHTALCSGFYPPTETRHALPGWPRLTLLYPARILARILKHDSCRMRLLRLRFNFALLTSAVP
jgi:hypothetical protein